jgi:hypothetical protein
LKPTFKSARNALAGIVRRSGEQLLSGSRHRQTCKQLSRDREGAVHYYSRLVCSATHS